MKKSLADSRFTSDNVEVRLSTDLGYFKEKRVSQSQLFLLRAVSLFSNHVLDILQVYLSSKSTHVYHVDYVCLLKYFCNCPVSFQVRHTQEYTTLRACNKHNADSHAQSKAKYLLSAQKAG
jgi:hypothetical protein